MIDFEDLGPQAALAAGGREVLAVLVDGVDRDVGALGLHVVEHASGFHRRASCHPCTSLGQDIAIIHPKVHFVNS